MSNLPIWLQIVMAWTGGVLIFWIAPALIAWWLSERRHG